METGTYKLAGRAIRICSLYSQVQEMCADYATREEPQFQVTTTQADIDREREYSAREDAAEGIPTRQFPDAYLETLAVYRQIANRLIHDDTLLFHGSTIAVDGQAFLFTAKSGTGKSTHTRLWREVFGQRAVMVNDDKPLLRILPEGVLACGTPWNGKHDLGSNICVPLKAICILERGEQNRIEKITAAQALSMLMQQSHRPVDAAGRMAYLELMDKLTTRVAFYRLRCNMEPEAALVAYEGMKV